MSEKYLYIRTDFSKYTSCGNKGHTGVGLVPRSGCLSAVILSPHFLQTTPAYTSNQGYPSQRFLLIVRYERYGPK